MSAKNYRIGELVRVIGWTVSGITTARIIAITADGYYIRANNGVQCGGWNDSDLEPA